MPTSSAGAVPALSAYAQLPQPLPTHSSAPSSAPQPGPAPTNTPSPTPLPPPDGRLARELAQESHGGWTWTWSGLGHGLLDLAGLVPVLGEPADMANGIWYAAEGNMTDAGLSFAGMIPGLGWGATGGKFLWKGSKVGEHADDVVDGVETAGDAAKVADAPPGALPKPPDLQVDVPPQYANLPRKSLESGKKGAWNSELHRPAPSTVFILDGKHVYVTDSNGRVEHVSSQLEYRDKATAERHRNDYQQRVAGREHRLEFDEGGHLIAASLGGPGEGINLVAMAKELNGPGRDNWNRLEAKWREAVKATPPKNIRVSVDVDYPPDRIVDGVGKPVTRPSAFYVEYTIDGGPPVRVEFFQ